MEAMKKAGYVSLLAVLFAVLVLGSFAKVQGQQYPIADKVAAKVIAHYQSSSCQELAAAKQHPPSGTKAIEEKRAVQYLHQNPQAAQHFINEVAGPIANKLFSCGMIP
jgi:hypothetical protein